MEHRARTKQKSDGKGFSLDGAKSQLISTFLKNEDSNVKITWQKNQSKHGNLTSRNYLNHMILHRPNYYCFAIFRGNCFLKAVTTMYDPILSNIKVVFNMFYVKT